MANYKDIHGFNIQSKSSDPTTGIAGDMYYNSSTGQFKAIKDGGAPIGSWASGGNMNSARFLQGGAGAANTAAVVFGGRNPSLSPGPNSNFTESYNGSSWTEVGDMNVQAAYWAGMGTSTAALAVGGSPPATAGKGYFCNTTSAAFTVTLPGSPSLGDEVTVVDYAGTADTNNITIGRNSLKIMGSAADLTVAIERAAFTLVYSDSTYGWLLKDK